MRAAPKKKRPKKQPDSLIRRMLCLLSDLRKGATVDELAEKYKIHRRTIGRNLRDLTSAGFRLTFIKDSRNIRRWYAKRLNDDLVRLTREGAFE